MRKAHGVFLLLFLLASCGSSGDEFTGVWASLHDPEQTIVIAKDGWLSYKVTMNALITLECEGKMDGRVMRLYLHGEKRAASLYLSGGRLNLGASGPSVPLQLQGGESFTRVR